MHYQKLVVSSWQLVAAQHDHWRVGTYASLACNYVDTRKAD